MKIEKAKRIMERRGTSADRFALSALRIVESHGGHPTASLENGRIVFTYPDGRRTSGGEEIKSGG